jgi:hypothetical protein
MGADIGLNLFREFWPGTKRVQRMQYVEQQTPHRACSRSGLFGGMFDYEQVEIATLAGGAYRIGPKVPTASAA